jgi:hypothetical protein
MSEATMSDTVLSPEKAEQAFWKRLKSSRTGMLGLDRPGYHSQPMTAFGEPETGTLWVFSRNDTDLAGDVADPGGQGEGAGADARGIALGGLTFVPLGPEDGGRAGRIGLGLLRRELGGGTALAGLLRQPLMQPQPVDRQRRLAARQGPLHARQGLCGQTVEVDLALHVIEVVVGDVIEDRVRIGLVPPPPAPLARPLAEGPERQVIPSADLLGRRPVQIGLPRPIPGRLRPDAIAPGRRGGRVGGVVRIVHGSLRMKGQG